MLGLLIRVKAALNLDTNITVRETQKDVKALLSYRDKDELGVNRLYNLTRLSAHIVFDSISGYRITISSTSKLILRPSVVGTLARQMCIWPDTKAWSFAKSIMICRYKSYWPFPLPGYSPFLDVA